MNHTQNAKSYPMHLRLLALALALALAWAAVGAGSVAALNGCLTSCGTTTYYSDASHHTVVGTFMADECGNCTGSGQITGYFTTQRFICLEIVCSVGS